MSAAALLNSSPTHLPQGATLDLLSSPVDSVPSPSPFGAYHASNVYLWAVVTLLFSIVYRKTFTKAGDPLRDIPGPFLARWTPLWLAYHARCGNRFRVVHAAHQKYGYFVRITPWHVSVADPDAIHVVYDQGERALPKSDFYDTFVSKSPSVFSARDHTVHRAKRRLTSHAFSVKSLYSVAPLVHARVVDFAARMDDMFASAAADTDVNSKDAKDPKDKRWINTMQWFNYLTFDIIADLTFGEPIGMVDKGSDRMTMQLPDGTLYDEGIIELVDYREHAAAVLGTMPKPYRTFFNMLPDPFFTHARRSNAGMRVLARQCVDKRLASATMRDDILNKLIESKLKETQGGVLLEEDISELTSESITLLIAGSHNAASSTTAILHYVKTNPRVFEKLKAELDDVLGVGTVPTWDQVRDLPYLYAVIYEGLRHHGTNAIGLPRIVEDEAGFECMGKWFPPGTEVSVPSWTMQHNDAVWGDPYNFRPERWLENSDARKYMMIFGHGTRVCLGRHLVIMEMQIILATLILRYDISLQSDILEATERFQHEPRHMYVNFKPRAQHEQKA